MLNVTRAEHEFHIEAFINDHFTLASFALAKFPVHADRVPIALAFTEDSETQWTKLASYALTELKWIEAERPLTPTEIQLRSIAGRIYDSSITVARRLGTDLYPEDTDHQAAREQLERAFQRAAWKFNLLDQKETKQ